MRYFIGGILFLLLFGACRSPRYVYAPSLPTNPFFEEKGETRIAGFYAGAGGSSEGEYLYTGYELQAAYAFANNWAVTFAHGHRKEFDLAGRDQGYSADYFNSSNIFYKRRMTDIGAGYFMAVDREQAIYIGLYGGMGFGYFTMRENGLDRDSLNYSGQYNGHLAKVYLQPTVSIHAGEFFKFGLSARISSVHFKEQKNNYTQQESEALGLPRIRNRRHNFFEPAIHAQFQIPTMKWIKLEGGFQFSTDTYLNVLEARSFTPFVGLSFDLGKLK